MVAEAMKKHFEHVAVLQLKDVEVFLGKEAGVYYLGKKLPEYHCVYLKGSFRYANLLRSIATLLERNVPYMPLSSSSFTIAHNKLLTHLILQQQNIPMPRTYVTSTLEAAKELLRDMKFPIVMKFPEGTQGKGVLFADSVSSALSLLDALGALKQPFIIQEYIETESTDIRALVVGEKVIAAMKRKAQSDDKRANIHAGGSGEIVELSRAATTIALATSRALKADICGVDILEGPLGPLVIEANISPGLQGLSQISTLDLANEIAKHLLSKTQEALAKNNKKSTTKVMKEIASEEGTEQEIVSNLQFRGDRILLPEIITRMTKFDERKEYALKAKKGKLEIRDATL